MSAIYLGLLLAPASQQATAQEACLNDVAQFNNAVCTANDVRISRINVLAGPVECDAGTDVTIDSLEAELLGGAKERYDIGIYLATDGGDAKASISGNDDGCLRNILSPLGEGAGEFDDLDGDACGDIRQGVLETKSLQSVTLECVDSDDDGFLDVGTCLSWDNNTRDFCGGEEDASPGTPSKCRCEPIQVGEIVVNPTGTIIIRKTASRETEDEFGFVFNNADSFALGDGETMTFSGLAAGAYTVSEDLTSIGWILTDISCDDDNSSGDPETREAMIMLEEDETVECTFTNTGTS